jgi:SH3-like domain-containing protein
VGRTAQVVVGHKSDFPDPLVAPAGTELMLEPRPSEFVGWVWCRDASGIGAWVPEAFLEIRGSRAVLTADYDSTELTVAAGTAVEVLREVAGWSWCRSSDGHLGWLPTANLQDPP